MARNIDDFDDLDTLALTIWGEARSESMLGRAAVACVIMNRVEARAWYGNSIKAVCLKGWQFSCWNVGDPNRDKMLNISDNDRALIECRAIATLAMGGGLDDLTRASTHYHTKSVKPKWSVGKLPVYDTGTHVFYNDID